MVHEHLKNLRLDKRLLRRRRWLSPEEVSRELSSLPDVGDKIQPPEEIAAAEEAGEAGERS